WRTCPQTPAPILHPDRFRGTGAIPSGVLAFLGSARPEAASGTVDNVEFDVVQWLMQPDSTGLELPDLANLIQRPEWFARASCRGSDLAPYFPGQGGTATEARAVCHTCVVRSPCLDYALADPDLV